MLIEAVIKPFVLDRVREALNKVGINSLTEVGVSDFGAGQPHHEVYGDAECVVDAVPRVQIRLVAPEESESSVIEAIVTSSGTASGSDGRILVMPLSKVVLIGKTAVACKAS